MRTDLTIPYTDTSPDQLCFALDLPELPALSALDVPGPLGGGGSLTLRLLGASHQAALSVGDITLTETLACVADRKPHLPDTVEHEVAGMQYRFAVRIAAHDPVTFGTEVAALRHRVAESRHGLVGVFPGDTDAVTALLAEPGTGRVSWHTWHAYPQTGHLVSTSSTAIAHSEGNPS